MSTTAPLARSTVELAQQRAAAELALAQGPYRAACARGFLATVDWLDGSGTAPLPQLEDATPGRAKLRAQDVEQEALRDRRQEDAWYAGYVAVTIGWLRDRSYPQTPFV